jgi:bifunctional non-homologous end joining protein LigD
MMANSSATASRARRRTGAKAAALPLPETIAPMLATPAAGLPANAADFTFEYKWDGVRALCYSGPGRFQLQSRNQLDITIRYPELHSLQKALGKRSVVLDGEIVSLDDVGRPSFAKLQRRMHLNHAAEIRRLSASEPIFYVLFDLLYIDGRSLLDEPYTVRRQLLEELTLLGAHWQVTPAHAGEGKSMLETATRTQLEGVVAKRLDSVYLPGRRSPAWLKIKVIQRQEFVIGGWIPERSGAADRLGALLVGTYDAAGKLRYAGKVGTGLSAADHVPLLQKLKKRPADHSPFEGLAPRGAKFVDPTLVAEIEYRRWPTNGMVQHAAYKGLRQDKVARQVVREIENG